MAVTAIWPIKGRVDQVINYARNPEKTTQSGLSQQASMHVIHGVVEYAANEMKTEQRSFVTGLHCREETAAAQFMETKRLWGKVDGRMCFHGYQAFSQGEVTAEQAHEIGVKLAQELWGDRFEVVVATHCNTGHYHSHFVINSVSFLDGRKFYNSPADYRHMREVSDRLCREYGLSVIQQPQCGGMSRSEWEAERAGKPTLRGSIRQDIDRAIRASTTQREFLRVLEEMGYQVKTRGSRGQPLKYPGVKPPDAKGYFRLHKLGPGYSLEEITRRLLDNIQRQCPFPVLLQPTKARYKLRGKVRRNIGGLRGLYFRYCYELHILVRHPASVKRVSFLLREDVVKLERLNAQANLLGRTGIDRLEDLRNYAHQQEQGLKAGEWQRQQLRNQRRSQLRRGDAQGAERTREQISALTREIRHQRREVELCREIAQRSGVVQEHWTLLMEQKQTQREEMNRRELFRGGSRTNGADEPGRG